MDTAKFEFNSIFIYISAFNTIIPYKLYSKFMNDLHFPVNCLAELDIKFSSWSPTSCKSANLYFFYNYDKHWHPEGLPDLPET